MNNTIFLIAFRCFFYFSEVDFLLLLIFLKITNIMYVLCELIRLTDKTCVLVERTSGLTGHGSWAEGEDGN